MQVEMIQKSPKKSTIKAIRQYFKTKQNQPSKQTDSFGHLKRGRKRNCYFQMMNCTFKHPQGTHSLGCLLRGLACGKRRWAQPETLNVNMRLSSAWAGARNAEDRKREASLRGFLTHGWHSSILGWKDYCVRALSAASDSSSKQCGRGWFENKFRQGDCNHGTASQRFLLLIFFFI